jgi:hypothetical protein
VVTESGLLGPAEVGRVLDPRSMVGKAGTE